MEIYNFNINNNPYEVKILSIEGGTARVNVNGTEYGIDVSHMGLDAQAAVPVKKTPMQVVPAQKPPVVKADAEKAKPVVQEKKIEAPLKKEQPAVQKAAGAKSIVSPMPGQVFKILVAEGESIKSGDIVVTIEAMKMENQIRSTIDGKVAAVHVKEGDVVAEGAPLVSLA